MIVSSYLPTPWCRVILEKLTGLHLVKRFAVFHGTRKFITALTSVRHLSLSRASPIQSIYPHSTSWRSVLILSNHLRLGLPSGLLPYGFPTKNLYTPLSSPIRRVRVINSVAPSNKVWLSLRWSWWNARAFWTTLWGADVTELYEKLLTGSGSWMGGRIADQISHTFPVFCGRPRKCCRMG